MMPDDGFLMQSDAPRQTRALLFANPQAGKGNAQWHDLLEHLRKGGLNVSLKTSENSTDISDTIIRLRHEIDCVIVSGGDGSMNAAARGLIETGLPLGIIPTGTGNDLARTLGISETVPEAAELIIQAIRHGHERWIDVGEVNGHPFFNVASIGLSVDLAEDLTRETKKRWGRLGYALSALRVFFSSRRFTAMIETEGGVTKVKTLQVSVGNGRHYGGGNVVETTAEIDDGQLDLYSIEADALWRLLLMYRSFRKGEHGAWDEVRTQRSTWFKITTRRPRAINADGEIVSQTPAEFRVRPKAVRVLVANHQTAF